VDQAHDKDRQPALREWVSGINPRYGFELRRRPPQGQWAVAQVDVDLSDGVSFTSGSPPSEAVAHWSTCPVTFALILGASRVNVQDPGFTVKRVTPLVRDGRDWAKVEFDYRAQGGDPRVPSFGGWVLYDPQRSWVIRELDVQMQWTAELKAALAVTYEYEEARDGFPIPKRVIQKYTKLFTKPPDRFENTFAFDLKEADVPESEFTLSAFGFPEPGGLRRPRRWYLWAAIIGVVCLSLAALLHWRARRAERTAVPPRP
jgi:hypothetical protein